MRFTEYATRTTGALAASIVCLHAAAVDNRVLVIPSNSAGVNIPYQAIQASPASSYAFTVEFWTKLDPTTSAGRIFNRRGCSCNGITISALNGSGSIKGLTVTIGGVYGSPGGAELPLAYGDWEHCAIVWSAASGTLQLYRNGALVNTISGVGSQFEVCGTEPLRFAEQCGWGIKGAMDNIRYWSVARTAAQILADRDVQYTASQAAQQTGLIGSWTFDDGVVTDSTGNNPTAALENGARLAVDNTVPRSSGCPADIDQSGAVNGIDLTIVLQNWGIPSPQYARADTNTDGLVNGADLSIVLAGWGACP